MFLAVAPHSPQPALADLGLGKCSASCHQSAVNGSGAAMEEHGIETPLQLLKDILKVIS